MPEVFSAAVPGLERVVFCAEECKVIDAAVMSRGIVLDFVSVLGELLINQPHTHARPHKPTHIYARTVTYIDTTRAHPHKHTTHSYALARTRTHRRTHARAGTHARTHAHTHILARTQVKGGGGDVGCSVELNND